MLDLRWMLAHREEVESFLKNRRHDFDMDALEALDEKRRHIIVETEDLKARRNEGSRKVGAAKKTGENVDALMQEIRLMGDRIKELDEGLNRTESELNDCLMRLPNRLSETTPVGRSDLGDATGVLLRAQAPLGRRRGAWHHGL